MQHWTGSELFPQTHGTEFAHEERNSPLCLVSIVLVKLMPKAKNALKYIFLLDDLACWRA